MSDRFALDQSVVYGALCGQPGFLRAIQTIVTRCDTIVFDKEWWNRCYPVVQRHGHTTVGLQLVALLEQAMAWKNKMEQVTPEPPALAEETGLHHKDLWLVRLAVAVSARVVADDEPLLTALRERGIPCMTPSDVLG